MDPEVQAIIQVLQSILVAYIVALGIFAVGGLVIVIMFMKVLSEIRMWVRVTAEEARAAAQNTSRLNEINRKIKEGDTL